MSTLVEELFAQAKSLSPEDRARLAEELLESLESLEQDPDTEVEAAWDSQIERRVAEVEAGTAKFIAAEDVYAEARRLIER